MRLRIGQMDELNDRLLFRIATAMLYCYLLNVFCIVIPSWLQLCTSLQG